MMTLHSRSVLFFSSRNYPQYITSELGNVQTHLVVVYDHNYDFPNMTNLWITLKLFQDNSIFTPIQGKKRKFDDFFGVGVGESNGLKKRNASRKLDDTIGIWCTEVVSEANYFSIRAKKLCQSISDLTYCMLPF